jgi:hypothetical protein
MQVTLEVIIEGKTNLDVSADVETFADMSKLAKKITDKVNGIKKLLPDMASKKVENVRIVKE